MRKAVIGALALVLCGLAFVSLGTSAFRDRVAWSPDGLYYQARLLEFRGVSEPTAMQRVFRGPISQDLRQRDPNHTGNAAWVKYNEPFYERRVAVPLAGAAIYDLAGDRSLLYLSLAGFFAAILALYGFLLMRFRPAVAGTVTLATCFLPPLVKHSSYPLTDSWGLAFEIGALAAGLLALDRGLRWLPLWIGAIVLLSFTRDSTWIPIIAAGWCAFRFRSRIPVTLFATGFVAALPALFAFTFPVRDLLALLVNNSNPSTDTSWSFIIRHYPGALVDLIRADVGFLRRGEWFTALYFVGGIASLAVFVQRRARDAASRHWVGAAAVAGIGYILAAPMFSAFRLELVLVPAVAYGLALAAEAAFARASARLGADPVPAPAPLPRS
jgi:hypothetical protein